ncbi:MAG TPA: hypothetical protein PKI14_03260 [Fervidobacterium sp.]|nr:hypothetical protein [Fervidobacterium sp.]
MLNIHKYFREAETLGYELDSEVKQKIMNLVISIVGKERYIKRFALIQTVAGSAIYDVPVKDIDDKSLTDCDLRTIYWFPQLLSSAIAEETDKANPSTSAISALIKQKYSSDFFLENAQVYGWEWIDDKRIMLIPVPVHNGYVVCEYAEPRKVEQFTAQEWDAVRAGCLAYTLGRIYGQTTSTVSWDAGTLALRFTPAQINALRDQWEAAEHEFHRLLYAGINLPG